MTSSTQIDPDVVKDNVRNFIINNFLFGEARPIGGQDSFLQTNLIDSTGILELVHFIEQTYEITVEDQEMVPENLDSLDNIARFVGGKRNG